MHSTSDFTPGKRFQFPLQPADGWLAIICLISITTVAAVAGLGKILNILFPLGSLAVGFFLYKKYPLLYTGFTWWLWFLAAFVRRVADYRGGGFTSPSLIILTPYLVTLITLITVYQHIPKLSRRQGLSFLLAGVSVTYGLLIGIINKSIPTAGAAFVDWLAPIPFGFHIFVHWRYYPEFRRNLERIFVWGVLVMGIYGLIQHLTPPAWELFWVDNSEMVSANYLQTFSKSADALRVWSTMGYSEQFGAVMIPGLLLLFISQSPIIIPAGAVGYLSLLLSMQRAAYAGWIAGFLAFVTSSANPKFQRRLMVSIVILSVFVIPLSTIEPFSSLIVDRVGTLGDIGNDDSASGRKEFFMMAIDYALASFLGDGLSGDRYDSTIFSLLYGLGWLGTIPYMLGLCLITFSLFRKTTNRVDPFVGVCRAVVFSSFVRFPVNGILFTVSNMVLWSFLALGVAALKYAQYSDIQKLQILHTNPEFSHGLEPLPSSNAHSL